MPRKTVFYLDTYPSITILYVRGTAAAIAICRGSVNSFSLGALTSA